jgi:indole-3-glycerol phosphate synthase
MAFLDEIVARKRVELASAKAARDFKALKQMLKDAPAVRSFSGALRTGFGLIAELKRKSPSGGDMRAENVEGAPAAYARSDAVKAVSVLTNTVDFGMSIEDLRRVREVVKKPVLRKDFIFDEYQVYEARAFGADALLLMVNVLERAKLKQLFELAQELGMDVLFEAHTKEEIEAIPQGAVLYGINSRKFKTSTKVYDGSRKGPDLTVELDTFSLVQDLPKGVIKIAESGVGPAQVRDVVKLGYDAILVGTSLLKATQGVERMLEEFEDVLGMTNDE